jgi:polar amino acid transport system substrate-binding protein
VIDFTVAYSPSSIAVFAPKSMKLKLPADLAGKSVAVTRGAIEDQELTKVAPPNVDCAASRTTTPPSRPSCRPGANWSPPARQVAGDMMAKNPQLSTEFKLLLKDSPLNFIGVAKGEDKLKAKVNEIIAEAKKDGDLDKMAKKWLGKAAGDLPV